MIAENGDSLGVLSKGEALRVAREADLDLVMIATSSSPPIAKIIDWGKYSYQKKKKQQQARQAHLSKSGNFKQMRFGMKIGDSDLDIKLRKVHKFLEEGCKVRLTIILKGREMEHKDLAFELAEKIVGRLEDVGKIENRPRLSGRQVNMIIRSNAK